MQEGMVWVGTGSGDKEAINDTGCYLLPRSSPVMASHSMRGEWINDGEWINEEAAVACGCLCWTCLYLTTDGHEGGQGGTGMWERLREEAQPHCLKVVGPGLYSPQRAPRWPQAAPTRHQGRRQVASTLSGDCGPGCHHSCHLPAPSHHHAWPCPLPSRHTLLPVSNVSLDFRCRVSMVLGQT